MKDKYKRYKYRKKLSIQSNVNKFKNKIKLIYKIIKQFRTSKKLKKIKNKKNK